MLSNCLKSRKIQKLKTLGLQRLKMEECFYQTEWFVIVKKRDLSKNKKHKGY